MFHLPFHTCVTTESANTLNRTHETSLATIHVCFVYTQSNSEFSLGRSCHCRYCLLLTNEIISRVFTTVIFRSDRIRKLRPFKKKKCMKLSCQCFNKHIFAIVLLLKDTWLVQCVCVCQLQRHHWPPLASSHSSPIERLCAGSLLQNHRDQPVPASRTHQPLMCRLRAAFFFLVLFFSLRNSCGLRQMWNPRRVMWPCRPLLFERVRICFICLDLRVFFSLYKIERHFASLDGKKPPGFSHM